MESIRYYQFNALTVILKILDNTGHNKILKDITVEPKEGGEIN